MNVLQKIEEKFLKKDLPEFRPGDTVRVSQVIVEGTKERVQVFEGIVIRRNGGGISETFTVRKISYGVGVEKIFPLHSPRVVGIEVKRRGRVRRARLYYLRELSGKAGRIKEARYVASSSVGGHEAVFASDTEIPVSANLSENNTHSETSSS